MSQPYRDRLVQEGMASRVEESRPAAAVDYERITRNLTTKYRLDWPEAMPAWPGNMSPITRAVAPLGLTYATIYLQVAQHCDSLGRKDEAADAHCRAVDWAVRGGRTEAAQSLADAWLAREPKNERARALKARLDSLNPGD
jgi:hypothetical protein